MISTRLLFARFVVMAVPAAALLLSGCGGDDKPKVVADEGGGDSFGGSTGTGGKTGKGGSGGASGGAAGASGGAAGAAGDGTGTAGSDAGCSDSKKNGDETDLDCGGSCPRKCANGQGCKVDDDCDLLNCGNDGKCAAPACNDKKKNGDETDIDCGGDTCSALCGLTKGCKTQADCESNSCMGEEGAKVCVEASCSDGQKNQDESDVDCGGACETKCKDKAKCLTQDDCESRACVNGACTAPTCTDAQTNGSETDKDCGGQECDPCGVGNNCMVNEDCETLSCEGGKCLLAECDDTKKNGKETDVDCGGECPLACADSKACLVGKDCISGVCQGNVCIAGTCNDGVKNGDETDIDCGAACTKLCSVGKACKLNDDCDTSTCVSGKCQLPSCGDGFKNGTESDIDCGAGCPNKCGLGKSCITSDDCQTKACVGADDAKTCAEATCSDGIKNQDETDIDCGGNVCPKCELTKSCKVASDCIDNTCAQSKCVVPTCNDATKNGEETDVDCGGPNCLKCGDTRACARMINGQLVDDNDSCSSKVCQNGVCEPPKCTDGVKNGIETDVDCGGNVCGKCDINQKCVSFSDCKRGSCEGGLCVCPVGMRVAPRKSGGTYCIDKAEVSNEEYDAFLTASVSTNTQPAECGWNNTFFPVGTWPYIPVNKTLPVAGVDWCDAVAYCTWRGLHLCGAVDGGAVAPASANDPDKSEWFNACSAQGVNTYPYAGAYAKINCNTEGTDRMFTDRLTLCVGGFSEVIDMSGNVAEWENSCFAEKGDAAQTRCLTRGGGFDATPDGAKCAFPDTANESLGYARDYTSPNLGFRCCL